MLKHRMAGRARQVGLSIVELMVGITIGLVVVAGATALFIGNLGNSRRLLVEARVNQDLRAAADVVARELRRAGYWENSIAGTVTTATGSTTLTNPNAAASAVDSSTITYSVARDTGAGRCPGSGTTCTASINTQDSDEQFGFKLDGGVLKMKLGLNAAGGENWQPLTDPGIVTVNSFLIMPTETSLNISSACTATCTQGANCPTLTVRSYVLLLKGTSVTDSGVSRVLRETVRIRNDASAGRC